MGDRAREFSAFTAHSLFTAAKKNQTLKTKCRVTVEPAGDSVSSKWAGVYFNNTTRDSASHYIVQTSMTEHYCFNVFYVQCLYSAVRRFIIRNMKLLNDQVEDFLLH